MRTGAVERSRQLQRGILLEYFTVGWNILEGMIAVASGTVAGSIALLGFGIDSFIETSSGGILLWRLHAEHQGANAERVERIALRVVGASLMLLAAYVAVDSLISLLKREEPARSSVGIGLAVISLIVMPWLAYRKRKAARDLSSSALRADSRQTSLCFYLSAILLCGLVLNALLGWWWADPVAALAMVPIIVKEGLQALHGKPCCDCE